MFNLKDKPKRVGIYVPQWFCNSSKSDQLFKGELIKYINKSGLYKALCLNLARPLFFSEKGVKRFIEKNNLIMIVQHDSKFYYKNCFYDRNIELLEKYIPIINSTECQKLGHDKIATKKILKENRLPILDDKVFYQAVDLEKHLVEEELYVIKPHNNGGGSGVKLIKKSKSEFWTFHNSEWISIKILDKKKNNNDAIKIKYNFNFLKSPLQFLKKMHFNYIYDPLLVEPYFNNHSEGFSSLRCTVIGNEVVESIKRTNLKNITSNISAGGVATKYEISNHLKEIAVIAKNSIGADYAGVDFLVCGDKFVIGEINIGPFTLFSEYTGVNVGKIFADYVIEKCNKIEKR